MNRARRKTFCDLGRQDNLSPVIEHPDQIFILDPSFIRVPGIDPYDPIVVPVNERPVVLDIVCPTVFGVTCLRFTTRLSLAVLTRWK